MHKVAYAHTCAREEECVCVFVCLFLVFLGSGVRRVGGACSLLAGGSLVLSGEG